MPLSAVLLLALAADPEPVRVLLTVDVEAFDPVHPRGTMRAVVQNDTDRNLTVTRYYDADRLVLRSGPLTLQRANANRAYERNGARAHGEELVFEVPLADLFGASEKWSWTWGKQARPPKSPIHAWSGAGFVSEVEFTLTTEVDGRAVTSAPLLLKVRPSPH